MSSPIMVGSTTTSTILAVVRYLMVALGGVLVAKGYLTDEQLNDIVGGLLVLIPAMWGAYLTWRNNNQKKQMARALPDSIAQVTYEQG